MTGVRLEGSPWSWGGPDNLRGRGVCATWHPPWLEGVWKPHLAVHQTLGMQSLAIFGVLFVKTLSKMPQGNLSIGNSGPPREIDWIPMTAHMICCMKLENERLVDFLFGAVFAPKKSTVCWETCPACATLVSMFRSWEVGVGQWAESNCNVTKRFLAFAQKDYVIIFWLPFILFKIHLFCMLFCHTLQKKHHIWWCISSTPIQAFIAKMAWNG